MTGVTKSAANSGDRILNSVPATLVGFCSATNIGQRPNLRRLGASGLTAIGDPARVCTKTAIRNGLTELGTRTSAPSPAQRLNPVLSVEGQQLVMVTQYMAAVPEGELRSGVGSLAEDRDQISTALDMLFLGF